MAATEISDVWLGSYAGLGCLAASAPVGPLGDDGDDDDED